MVGTSDQTLIRDILHLSVFAYRTKALPTTTCWIVGDVHPLIKLLDQLVKGQVGVFDFLVKLLDTQVACLDVYRLTGQVLTAWRSTHGLIYLGTSVAAIDENRPAKPIP